MGQMAWLYSAGSRKFRILHLKTDKGGWRPYTCFPQFCVEDHKIPPGGSKGWATYQKLRENNWQLIETATAEKDRNGY
jgi:hypothetical protein